MWTFKNLLLFLCCVFLIFLAVPITINPYDDEFEMYLKAFNKSYADENVYRIRLQAFKKSLEKINELNYERTSNSSAFYGLTEYSDLPEEEFVKERLSLSLKHKRTTRKITDGSRYDIKEKENESEVYNLYTIVDRRKNVEINKKLSSVESFKEEQLRNNSVSDVIKVMNTADTNKFELKNIIDQDVLTIFQKYFNNKQPYKNTDINSLPRKIDWREKGVITEVNNQQSCGACWAFSAIEMIESMSAIRSGVLRKLSAQQLIDCSRNGNAGCNGGDVCSVLRWIEDEDVGLFSEEEYPLHLKTEVCKLNQNGRRRGVRIKDFNCDTFVDNEVFILHTLANRGPVAVAINAILWQNYLKGVVHYHCSSHPKYLNHAVLIVGYNLDAEIPYYIARNSWGKKFGENGYIYIGIGKNICGIANEVAYVDV